MECSGRRDKGKSPEKVLRKRFDDLVKPKDHLEYHTFDGWLAIGYSVMPGEIGNKWDEKGRTLFSEDQVQFLYDEDEIYYSDPFWD